MLDIGRYAQSLRETRRMSGLNGRYNDRVGGAFQDRESPYVQKWQTGAFPFQGAAGVANRESGFPGASRPVPVVRGQAEVIGGGLGDEEAAARAAEARKIAEMRQQEARRLQLASAYSTAYNQAPSFTPPSIGVLRAPTGFRSFR